MKVNIFFRIIIFSLLVLSFGCNKDNNEDDPTTNTSSYFKAKINNETVTSKKVIGGSLLEIFQFVPYDDSDNVILAFTIYNYKGVGTYNNSEDITVQYNGQIYRGKNGSEGIIKIEFDNQLVNDGAVSSKGNFSCVLFNLLDDTEILEIKDANFLIRK